MRDITYRALMGAAIAFAVFIWGGAAGLWGPVFAANTTPAINSFTAGNTVKPFVALTNTAVSVKAQPGLAHGVLCSNPNAAVIYIQFFDVSGTVTVGTTPPAFVVPIPASTSFSIGTLNIRMFNAIQVAATTTWAGSTAPGAAMQCDVVFQ